MGQNINAAMAVVNRIDGRPRTFHIGEVDLKSLGISSAISDVGGDALCAFPVDVENGDGGTSLRKKARTRLPHAGRATGDDYALTLKIHERFHIPSPNEIEIKTCSAAAHSLVR